MKLDIANRPIHIYCDNRSTIRLIKTGLNTTYKGKYKDVDYHCIQDTNCHYKFLTFNNYGIDPSVEEISAKRYKKHVSL